MLIPFLYPIFSDSFNPCRAYSMASAGFKLLNNLATSLKLSILTVSEDVLSMILSSESTVCCCWAYNGYDPGTSNSHIQKEKTIYFNDFGIL